MYPLADLFGENTGLYFFSAVFQGNMALLALIGVFIVFKIQQLNSSISQINDLIIRFVKDTLSFGLQPGYYFPLKCEIINGVPDIYTALSNIKENDPLFGKRKKLEEDNGLKKIYEESKFLNAQKAICKARSKLPILWTIATICFSIVCLPMVNTIHSKIIFLEISLVLIGIILNTITLISNYSFIKSVVKNC
ncbi:hypothetical protein JXJ21_24650 [candidate division KSB1 bacterium]|nr:hypothetical protein [candidate division KSB1 bacterium]